MIAGLAVFLVLYGLFLFVHVRFPYVQSGAALVTERKRELARKGPLFKDPASLKIMAFGHSKMLSGMIPEQFDSELKAAGLPPVESYNFGLPGELAFLKDLEAAANRGEAPDIALLMVPWPAEDEPGPTIFKFLKHDREIMNDLFPFRKLPRDFSIMAMEARGSPSGIRRAYLESERTINQVMLDRGYYFIERQSHYLNDELPIGFRAPTDTPEAVSVREIPAGAVFERVVALCAKHRIRCVFVPAYYREGQFAMPPAKNERSAAFLSGYGNFDVVGPDYFVYPNRLFSDPIHVNRAGAVVYTRALAGLVAAWIREHVPQP